jgi:hypothetical protein
MGSSGTPSATSGSVAMPVRMSKQEMEQKRQAAMAMFEKGSG